MSSFHEAEKCWCYKSLSVWSAITLPSSVSVELSCISHLTLGLDLPNLWEVTHCWRCGAGPRGSVATWLRCYVKHASGRWFPEPRSLLCTASPQHWHRAESFPFSFTCRAVVRNIMENTKPRVGKTQLTQTAAKDLRNEHTFEHLPSHIHGAVSASAFCWCPSPATHAWRTLLKWDWNGNLLIQNSLTEGYVHFNGFWIAPGNQSQVQKI